MKSPFKARSEYASEKRAFRDENPDVRRVYSAGEWHSWLRPRGRTPLTQDQRRHWEDNGFLVLRGFFPTATMQAYKNHVDRCWHDRARPDNPLAMFSARGGFRFRDADADDRTRTYRLQDQYLVDAPTRDLCMDPRLVGLLQQLMGHAPVVCNTLLFEWGSEQDMHSDMFYMAPISRDQMVATWVAVDDVTEDNGPLVYVPGSHKIPPHLFSHGRVQAIPHETAAAVAATQAKMDAAGLKSEKFLAKSGDVLIWHSRLVHGGGAIHDRTATRTSLVTHYFSTRDIPTGEWFCAERDDGSLLMVKQHLSVG